MANVVISEVLCCLSNNYEKLIANKLKPVLTNFYKDEELGTAKEILFKAVSMAVQHVGRDIDLPRLPKWQGPNKSRQTVDNLITLYDIADYLRVCVKLDGIKQLTERRHCAFIERLLGDCRFSNLF